MVRAGKWLTLAGVVLAIIGIGVGVWATIGGFRQVLTFDDKQIPVNQSTGGGFTVEQHFDKGQKIALYTYGANGVYVGPIPRCEVTGPAPVKPGSKVTSSVTIGQRSRISFAAYVIDATGTYRITCDAAGVTIAPPLSAGGMVGATLGLILAIFSGIAGAMLLIGGIVLWVVGGRRVTLPAAED